MITKVAVLTALLCLGLVLGMVASSEVAYAQGKSIAEQEGLVRRELDKDKMPGKLEVGLAIGSTIAMIAALKWL